MSGWTVGAMAVVQKEIFAAERRHAGPLQDSAGEIFVRSQRRGSGVVLRIPGASSGPEMNDPVACGDAEQQPRSAVDIAKNQSEFGAGKFRIDRLVRIEARSAETKFAEAAHAVSLETFSMAP